MAEGSNVQHIAELGVDLGTAYKQLEEFSKYVEQMGVTLNDLSKNNWNLEATISGISNTGSDAQKKLAEEALKANDSLKQQASVLDDVDKKQESLLAKSGKWFTAYQAWHLLKKGMVEVYETMRDVETRMMEIGRVMDTTAAQGKQLQDALFGVAQEMAQTFEGASEISLRFAQAGYHDMAENIELTRVALLAMNTAELDAVNSTNSLVGILKQWNLEASDLITVVDKLNYTADSNAITTQDLVDGLLRASGAAKNAKISFDETVGTLVALREATGRTGRELGTALNSLIAFTTRDSSLNVFENLGVTVWLDEQKTQLNSVMDIWRQLSEVYKTEGEKVINTLSAQTDMTELFAQEVAEAADAMDEYNQMLEVQNKLSGDLNDAERKKLTEQFGVYRRNYVIALLEDFGRIKDVVDDMDNAIGHSARENERYMQTLEAKTNQLKTALQELAVQAGEAGLLDLAKGAVDALTALANLTKSVGGLVPVLITLSGVLAIIKQNSIEKAFVKISDPVINSFKNASDMLRRLATESQTAGGGVQGFSAAMKLAGAEASAALGPAGWIGLLITAFGLVTMAVQAYKQAVEEARQADIAAGNSAQERINALEDLARTHERLLQLDLASDDEQYLSLQFEIKDAIGGRTDALDGLTAGTEKYSIALQKVIDQEREYIAAALEAKRVAQERQLQDAFADIGTESSGLYIFGKNVTGEAYAAEELINKYYELIELQKELFNDENYSESKFLQNRFEGVSEEIGKVKDAAEAYLETMVRVAATEYESVNGYIATSESLENLRSYLYESTDATDAMQVAIDKLLSSMYPSAQLIQDIADAAEQSVSAFDQWASSIDATEKNISDLRSEISSLESSMEALANGQGLTLDKTLDLLNTYPELASAIHVVGDEWYFEADALEILRQAKYNDLIATQAKLVYDELSASMTAEQRDRLHELTIALIEATDATTRQAAAAEYLAYVHSVAAGEAINYASALKQIELISAAAGRQIVSSGASYQGSADAIKRNTAATKANTDAINENIKALQKQQKEADKAYKKQIEAIQKEQKAADAASKARIKALQKERDITDKSYQARIKAYQAELKEITASYKAQEEAVKKRYNAEIEALRKLKQEENRSDDEEDYNRKRQEILAKIAEEEKRTGREATESIKSLKKELEELDRQEERRLRDNTIDDQIEAIEAVRDAELEAIKKAMEAQQDRYEKLIENLQAEKEAAKESYNVQIEAMQAAADAQKEAFNAQIEAIKEKQQIEKEALEAQIENLREQVEAAKKSAESQISYTGAVGEANKDMADKSEVIISKMYKLMEGWSSSWSSQASADGKKVLSVYQSISTLMDRISSQSVAGSGFNNLKSNIRSSHTGSLITGDGFVNLQAGELVVRRDISEGLMRNVRLMDQIYNNYHNNYSSNQNNSRNYQFGDINLNGGQFGNRRQAQQAGRSAAEQIKYELDRMP